MINNFILPKKWCVRASKCGTVQQYFLDKPDNNIFDYTTHGYENWWFYSNKVHENPTVTSGYYANHILLFDYTEITLEQFKLYVLKENLEDNFILPEKWCVYITNGNLVPDKYKSSYTGHYYAYSHTINGPIHNYCTSAGKLENYTEITFDQFKKYVLENNIKINTNYIINLFKRLNIN